MVEFANNKMKHILNISQNKIYMFFIMKIILWLFYFKRILNINRSGRMINIII